MDLYKDMIYEDVSIRQQHEATKISWNAPYVGEHNKRLASSIQKMKKEAKGAPYKNIMPMVQSSGTGKSRLAHEVAKIIFTIPSNIRPPEDRTAYPAPDCKVRSFLTSTTSYWREALAKHIAFFIAMFRVAAAFVAEMSPGKMYDDEQTLAADWRDYLDEDDRAVRTRFYDDVIHEANAIVHSVKAEAEQGDASLTPGQVLKAALEKLQERAQSEGPRKLIPAIQRRLADGFKCPDVVVLVYIDEVYEISTLCFPDTDKESSTVYDTLLDAFTHLGPSEPIFLLPITTAPSVVREGGCPMLHQSPWNELPFDLSLDGDYLFHPGTMTLDDVSEPLYMAKFGRLLFSTRARAAAENRLTAVQDLTVNFALAKLVCYNDIAEYLADGPKGDFTTEERLAPLCTRLLVEFNLACPAARTLTELMVERHMRIMYVAPEHNEFIRSGASSEPLLAEAAAKFMNECGLDDWAAFLAEVANDDIIKTGDLGDLVARLLLTLAFDRAGNAHHGGNGRCYSKAVPVVDFLGALFADQWHDTVFSSTPLGAQVDAVPLREAFKNAFVRFSHFAEFDSGDVLDTHIAAAAVARGFALWIASVRVAVHIAIPVVMKDEKLDAEVMSWIFIQLKTGRSLARTLDQDDIDDIFHGNSNSYPFIHIAMQLHPKSKPLTAESPATESPTADSPEPEAETSIQHPCYKLTAYGCSPSVYNVIKNKDKGHFVSLVDNYPYQDPASIAAVHQMKIEWIRVPACFDWADDPSLQSRGKEDIVEGVFAA